MRKKNIDYYIYAYKFTYMKLEARFHFAQLLYTRLGLCNIFFFSLFGAMETIQE